jgi:signal transduction histidine kinase
LRALEDLDAHQAGDTVIAAPRRETAGDPLDDVRRQLARELHDSVAQTLTVMLVDMENFKLDQVGRSSVQMTVDQLQGSTREVLRNLRQVLYDLRGEGEDQLFVPSVRDLVARFESRTGIKAKLTVTKWPAELSRTTAHNLYRIVEEALNNVRLHSGAEAVEIDLASQPGQSVALTVTDNGRGLSGHGQSGLGVVGMHERALLLGGELQVETVGDRGTVVRAVVPFESREITA